MLKHIGFIIYDNGSLADDIAAKLTLTTNTGTNYCWLSVCATATFRIITKPNYMFIVPAI